MGFWEIFRSYTDNAVKDSGMSFARNSLKEEGFSGKLKKPAKKKDVLRKLYDSSLLYLRREASLVLTL